MSGGQGRGSAKKGQLCGPRPELDGGVEEALDHLDLLCSRALVRARLGRGTLRSGAHRWATLRDAAN